MIVVLGLVVIFYFILILPRWVVVDVGRGYLGKSAFTALSSPDFPPDLGGWKLWVRERKLSPGFSFLPIFSPLPNSGKHCFPPYFPPYVFHPLYFHSNQTQCKSDGQLQIPQTEREWTKSHAAWDFTKNFPSLVPESLFVALFVDLELIWNLFCLLWIINALNFWVLFCEFIFHIFKYEISSHARGFFIFTFSYMSCIWTQISFKTKIDICSIVCGSRTYFAYCESLML